MVTWNANGLISKKDELIDFLTDHNKDIVFLKETHLKNDHVGIPNHKIFRKGRLGRNSIGVKRNLSVIQADLDSNRINNTEAIGVEVNTQRGRLRLVSVYNPSTSILSEEKDELIDFLTDHNKNIVFLKETHLKNDHVGIPNYKIFRKDSNRLNNTEAIGVEVNTQRGRLRLVSVYNPSTSILSEDALDSLIDEVNTPTILEGDFNAEHVSWNRVTNSYGLRLRRHCDNSNYLIEAPDHPTHYGANRPDILDIVLYKNITWNINSESISELCSGHNPVSITLGQSAQVDSYYNTTDWENFKLRSTTEYCAPELIESPDELDNVLKKFEQLLKTFAIVLLT
ncbi:hypothetical protein JTB14_036139 [Gonioctena quinquepunctata]|nr:hypothetical protein JTB14_036139 [Gonioctena quinquepunctata]